MTPADQRNFVQRNLIKDPLLSHPLTIERQLYQQSQGQIDPTLSKKEIKNTMSNTKKIFMPSKSIEVFRFAKIISGEVFYTGVISVLEFVSF